MSAVFNLFTESPLRASAGAVWVGAKQVGVNDFVWIDGTSNSNIACPPGVGLNGQCGLIHSYNGAAENNRVVDLWWSTDYLDDVSQPWFEALPGCCEVEVDYCAAGHYCPDNSDAMVSCCTVLLHVSDQHHHNDLPPSHSMRALSHCFLTGTSAMRAPRLCAL
jgi:hypothetical protein